MATIQIKRIYEAWEKADGKRILIDRLWPRGVKKEAACLDEWMKDVAPSTELRKWFNHDAAVWQEFEAKYITELKQNTAVNKLLAIIKTSDKVTLLYAAHDETHNHAIVLLRFINAAIAV